MPAVEGTLGNARGLGRLGDLFPDRLGRLDVATVDSRLGLLALGAGRYQRSPGVVVDQLGVHVLRAAEDRQARPLGRTADAVAHVAATPQLPDRLQLLVVHRCLGYLAPAAKDLPSLRRTTSFSYRTPLP